MNSRGGKHGRCSPQNLLRSTSGTKMPSRRRKPLSDHNSASTSSDAPPAKGCFRFLLSNSSSKSSPHRKAPTSLRRTPSSSSRDRYGSLGPPSGSGHSNAPSVPKENGTRLVASYSHVVSTPGKANEQGTPPVQASISPEIHSSSEIGKDGSACFAAGHIVSKVNDRRKCKPRGILTVGGREMNPPTGGSVSPQTTEAYVSWLESPIEGRRRDAQNGSFESENCSPTKRFDLGYKDRFAKCEWGSCSWPIDDQVCNEADFRNEPSSSPRNISVFRTEEIPGDVVCESLHISQKCMLDCGFVETPKTSSFAFHKDQSRVVESLDAKERSRSFSEKLSWGDAQEKPKNGSFSFAQFDCSLSSEVELGLQYNWNSSSSKLTGKDESLEEESSSEVSAKLKTECQYAGFDSEDRQQKTVPFSRFDYSSSLIAAENGSQQNMSNDLSSRFRSKDGILEGELCEIIVAFDNPTTESIRLPAEGSNRYDGCPLSTLNQCSSNPPPEVSSSLKLASPNSHGCGSVSGSWFNQNHSNTQDSFLKCHRELYDLLASPMLLKTPFSVSKKLPCSPYGSESDFRNMPHDHGLNFINSSTINTTACQKSPLPSLESPSSESKELLHCLDRMKLDGNNVMKNLSSLKSIFTNFDDGKCNERSVAIQETAYLALKKSVSCLDASEIEAVCSPSSSGSSWNQNIIKTPSTCSDHCSLEFNSMDDVLQTLRSTQDRAAFLPLPGFDYQFYFPSMHYHSVGGTCIGDPSSNPDTGKLISKGEHENDLLSPTFDNISNMRVSWRDGLISRIFEMEEIGISELLKEEQEVHVEECHKPSIGLDTDSDPNLGSPVLDNEKFLLLSVDIGSMEFAHTPKNLATEDSDWRVCYRNHLFEETA